VPLIALAAAAAATAAPRGCTDSSPQFGTPPTCDSCCVPSFTQNGWMAFKVGQARKKVRQGPQL
jgi:hypothetical protein